MLDGSKFEFEFIHFFVGTRIVYSASNANWKASEKWKHNSNDKYDDMNYRNFSKFRNFHIEKYQIYEKYLQSVVDILPPDYLDINEPHINDIIMRHKTLVETNDDLINMVQSSQDNIENQAGFLLSLIKVHNF